MMTVKDFKTCGYFSGHMIFFGVFLLFTSFMLVTLSMPVVGAILVLPAVLILTTHYRLRIDFERKTYHDYLWVMGMKTGEKGTFQSVEYLFLKAAKVSQTMQLRVASSTVNKDVIDAYIRLVPEKKIHLFTKDSRHDALVRLKEIANTINVRIVDYTKAGAEEAN